MNINRRDALFGAASLGAVTSQSVRGQAKQTQVSQQVLDEAIRLHAMWLADMSSGQRCVFGGRDLSGLKFAALGGGPIDLNGADFAQADLSGTEADDILLHHCSFNGATLDRCHWRRPVFAFADMRRVSARLVKWGVPDYRGSLERSPADFGHTVLHDADLSEANVCGFFYGTKFRNACLKQADLSLSDFLGPSRYEMSFSGANLCGAKLHDCRISSASLFNADCAEADFFRTVFSDVRMKGCNLARARFQGTEIDRTTFSPDQIRDANFGDTCLTQRSGTTAQTP
jgi:uncharacterized protein YjbI with pentapeptide repeats